MDLDELRRMLEPKTRDGYTPGEQRDGLVWAVEEIEWLQGQVAALRDMVAFLNDAVFYRLLVKVQARQEIAKPDVRVATADAPVPALKHEVAHTPVSEAARQKPCAVWMRERRADTGLSGAILSGRLGKGKMWWANREHGGCLLSASDRVLVERMLADLATGRALATERAEEEPRVFSATQIADEIEIEPITETPRARRERQQRERSGLPPIT